MSDDRTFWVLWTYVANYSHLIEVRAPTADDAARRATAGYSADFRKRATVYVFEHPPVLVEGEDE